MMRGQQHMAVAVRAPDGRIVVHEEPLKGALYRHPAMKLPLLRGFVALWDALGLGMKSLMFSANVAADEVAPPEGSADLQPSPQHNPKSTKDEDEAKIQNLRWVALPGSVSR
jgi:uncharacterized protein YqhQ